MLFRSGFSPQLPVEGLIAARGGFPGIAHGSVAELSYWRMSGLRDGGGIDWRAKEPELAAALIDGLAAGLTKFIAAFDDESMPYRSRPRPEYPLRYPDYDHLARVREWSAGPGEDEVITFVPLRGPR